MNSPESTSVDKPFETTDYETTNVVVVEGNRIPSQRFQFGIHQDSYYLLESGDVKK